ncbi:uncharacterized protein FOMMEDRAFT_112858 [Fomitiporia mediterranea MF3/22]|uniref:uncharacterized protein n=1 Tax=Fomitiporia mediterranea (strain MF3/22) TaxID=694068 RepID=UPI0004408579|nr:uncharacterized protein FOMMEDRAFT_112858 [Fomitiporia mediterranea MF3/22]EJC99788.1 hypothetical protein FOMMEDRAFT_112858 [Fomitiporia mediterranea MF3/22]
MTVRGDEPLDPPEDDEELTPSEKWWRDHYELLEKHGYRLRPRYRPEWTPSWKGTGKNPLRFEDNIWNKTRHVIDATCVKDAKTVSIKRIARNSPELSIALYLSDVEGSETSMNHCVPILDHFSDSQFAFLVMPVLRWFDDPPFFSVDEVVDFVRQTLEGLKYMHSKGVAHRDCAKLNIMMDATTMYPKGFHPAAKLMDPSGVKPAPVRRRRDVSGVKYCFIDFGISTRFDPNVKEDERRVTGIDGLDRDVPELSANIPYDPFAVDVFILGNVYRKSLLNKYVNLAFLTSLVDSMTSKYAEDRPSAAQALDQFHNILKSQSRILLRWRLKEKDAGFVTRIFQDIGSVTREGIFISRTIINLPLKLLHN